MLKSLGTKDQVPFEKGDLELPMEPYTHLPNQVIDGRARPEEVFYIFFAILAAQSSTITNSSHRHFLTHG